MAMWDTLADQFRPQHLKHPTYKTYHAAFLKLQKLSDDLIAYRSKTEAPGTLSQKGVLEAVRAEAQKLAIPNLRRIQHHVQQAGKKLESKRKALSVPAFDKTDIAGAMLRAELRAHLRNLDEAKRTGLLSVDPDPMMVAAVFEAPECLTDVSGEFRQRIETVFVETHYPKEVSQIEEERELLNVVGMALEISGKSVRETTGFANCSEIEFQRWMTSISTVGNDASGFTPDVDALIEMATSIPDWKDRFRITDAILATA